MKQTILLVAMAAVAVAQTGCKSPYYADRGAAFGGLSGAAIGAAIGEHNDNPLAGAIIGGVAGTIAGRAVGQSIDDDVARERAIIQNQIGRQIAGAATVPDVIQMTQSQVSEQVIVSYIQKSGVASRPQAADVIALQQQGVSQNVINAMINAPLANQQVSYQQPAPRPFVVQERVYVRPSYCATPRHHYHHRRHYHRDPGVHLGVHFD
jgi:uncharacterized membrane protein